MKIKVGNRVVSTMPGHHDKRGRVRRGVVTYLFDRGGTITPVASRVHWDGNEFQSDHAVEYLILESEYDQQRKR